MISGARIRKISVTLEVGLRTTVQDYKHLHQDNISSLPKLGVLVSHHCFVQSQTVVHMKSLLFRSFTGSILNQFNDGQLGTRSIFSLY